MQSYVRGVAYAVLGGVSLSSGGLIVRFIENADAWLLLFYRSIAFFFTVFVFIVVRDKGDALRRFREIRLADFIVSGSLASGFIFYVLSLYHTSVANTVLLLSTGPLLVAVLAWFVLAERVAVATWVAMTIAIAGIAVMVSGGVAGGELYGFAYALLAVLSFAIMVVTLRKAGQRDMIAATALAGIVAALCCVPMINSFQISHHDLRLAVCMGSLQVGMGFIFITLASRSVPAAQIPLLALGETALSPLWVWIFANEVPATTTLVGGAVVIFALILQGALAIKADPDSAAEARVQ